ncbi:MAG: MFS transporter [Synechococcales cyanobacterium T60_A2020_003]|nr:MFS transporter [Synechococcales cyanobacterium T60_A2020_003]
MKRLSAWLPKLDRRVWVLSAGRLLSQIGNGFVLFYAPIFFVNQVGLPATLVGIGIGSGSIAGIFGRILGGSLSDSPRWGRRFTLLLSAVISAIADVALAISSDFSLFLIGNWLMGLGIGLYWPATESVVADLTLPEQRNEAFALVRLADSIGLSSGVILGGLLISLTGMYRLLFVLDGLSYVIFLGIIYVAIAETLQKSDGSPASFFGGWGPALRDRTLLIYVVVNMLFTSYLAQIQSTMPVYFTQTVTYREQTGFPEAILSLLFTWHVVLTAMCQLPVARFLNRFRPVQALIASALFWGIGFSLIWVTGTAVNAALLWALLALAVMAIATVAYTPVASALVVDLAPNDQRGVYLSINSLCWAVGYMLGPSLGGWALDQAPWVVDSFWIGSALSVLGAIAILLVLDRRIKATEQS